MNLHGGVLAGVGVLGLWMAARVADRRGGSSSPPVRGLGDLLGLALLAVVCALALLMNPYRAGLIRFLLPPRPRCPGRGSSEWAPLSLSSLPGLVFLGLLALGIAGLVESRRRPRPEAILIFAATTVMAISSNRHYPLFALTLVVLVGEHIADVWNRWSPSVSVRAGRSRLVAMTGVIVSTLLLLVVSASLFAGPRPRFGCIQLEPFYFRFPARIVAMLRESRVQGNMAVPFDWGEYVLWHLGPQVKVSIDGRRETVYSDESYRESLAFEHGTGVWNAVITASPTDLVLAPNASPTTNLLSRTAGWRPTSIKISSAHSSLAPGFPDLGRILDTRIPDLPADGGGLCFPGPPRILP